VKKLDEYIFDEGINQSVNHMRRVRRGGLRLWILSALQGSPKNGAELINRVELVSAGFWRPSTGSVYPLLEALTKEGLIKKREDSRYELTEQGHQELEWPLRLTTGYFAPESQKTVDLMVSETENTLTYLEDLKAINRDRVESVAGRLRVIRKITEE
jgi:DNA-binding PadR family transcriptional regulator